MIQASPSAFANFDKAVPCESLQLLAKQFAHLNSGNYQFPIPPDQLGSMDLQSNSSSGSSIYRLPSDVQHSCVHCSASQMWQVCSTELIRCDCTSTCVQLHGLNQLSFVYHCLVLDRELCWLRRRSNADSTLRLDHGTCVQSVTHAQVA